MQLIKKRFIAITILLISLLNIYSQKKLVDYDIYKDIPTDELLTKCYDLVIDRHQPDSAVVPLTIITQRYRKDISVKEKELCYYAYIYLFYIYFYEYYYYSNAYDYLEKAVKIRDEIGLVTTNVDSYLAHFYYTLSTLNNDRSLNKKSLKHLKKAFEIAYKANLTDKRDKMFCRIIHTIIIYDSLNINDIHKEWEIYKDIKHTSKDSLYNVNRLLYRLVEEHYKRNYDEALTISDSICALPESVYKIPNSKIYSHLISVRIYEQLKDYDSALRHIKMMEKIANDNNTIDGILETYIAYYNYYDLLGDKKNSDKYRIKYYAIRDKQLNKRQVTALNKKNIVTEVSDINKVLNENRIKNEQHYHTLRVIIVTILVIVLLTFIVVRIRGNKKQDIGSSNDTDTQSLEKYQGYRLDDEYMNELLEKITKVMENVEEISSPSFSLERLAELTGTNYKYVSQVINDKCGLNFKQLLNKYRIEEVCRRISDEENYGMYTTEAIAESVGFKSRSAFASSFKKITGVTPSQYKKDLK